MANAIDRDLRRTEKRETQLWFLALGLLLLFGGVIVVNQLIDSGGVRATASNAVGALFLLTVLFCLYLIHTRFVSQRTKSLLLEMSNMTASGMEIGDFLPSVAGKIARVSSFTLCQIALLAPARGALELASAHAGGGTGWQPRLGKRYALQRLPVCGGVAETLQPRILRREGIAQLPPDGEERELLTGGMKNLDALLILPLTARGRLLGALILGEVKRATRKPLAVARIAMAEAVACYVAIAIDQSNIKKEAIRDPLTDLYNRRHFGERLSEEIASARRSGQPIAILLCDLDGFKAINDTHGHQVGDEALRSMAKSIQGSTRGSDLVFRWGGDEIVVVLRNGSREGALIVARRIRKGVRRTAGASGLDLDVSVGIALYPENGSDREELIRVADRALYMAKSSETNVHLGEEDHRLDPGAVNHARGPAPSVDGAGP